MKARRLVPEEGVRKFRKWPEKWVNRKISGGMHGRDKAFSFSLSAMI